MIGKILCSLGIHAWRRAGSQSNAMSNVIERKSICRRCGKAKTVFETK